MIRQAVARLLLTGLVTWPASAISQTPADRFVQTPAERFIGLWEGAIQLGSTRLRLGLTVEHDSPGAVKGFMTSIDQGHAKMPATLTVRGDTLVVDIPLASASYRAVIAPGRDSLRGTFTQGGSVPLTMRRTTAMTIVSRPQEPKPPFPYRTDDVSFESKPGVRLAGTLSLPPGSGPFPAVVMVSGSGPQDRDENLMGHKPFLLLADYLAKKGIASLRYDDRGFGKSTGDHSKATSLDFADDAEAAVRFLQANPSIARDRVGILGHSEGGMIGPIVAARSMDVAFLVLMAGPGIPGDSILMLQQRALLVAAGMPGAEIDIGARINRVLFDAARAGGDSAAVVGRLRAGMRELYPTLPEKTRKEATEEQIVSRLLQTVTPWFRYFIPYDPRPTLRRVTVPVLALNGTLDLQVPYKENLSAMDAAFKDGKNKDYRLVELPSLNHLFQTAKTGGLAEYSALEETISPSVLEMIAGWITERFGRR
jgi:uncharacterized protein